MKNTAIESFCEWGIVYSLSALIFVLPASIALVDSFAGLAITFYFLKKIYRMIVDWPVSNLDLLGRVRFIRTSLAPPVNFLDRPLLLLSLAIFVSVLFSQYPALSFFAYLGKFLKVILLYFCFIEALNDQKRIQIFLNFFLLSAFITVLSGAIQHYSGKDFIRGHIITSDRINASFFTANGFGAYLLPVFALVVHLLFSTIVRNRSLILVGGFTFLTILVLACLCWTYSRSAWVGYLIILFVMWFLDRRKLFFTGALFFVFIFIFLPSLNSVRHLYLTSDNMNLMEQTKSCIQRVNPIQGVNSNSTEWGSGRNSFWKKAISITRSSPVCGTGLNTYTKIIKKDPDKRTWWYAHNSYLQLAAETGLLGLACFIWMLLVLLWNSLNYCKQIKGIGQLTLLQGALSGLLGLLIQSFFDNTFFSVQLNVLLWMIIGLIVAVTRLNSKGGVVGH